MTRVMLPPALRAAHELVVFGIAGASLGHAVTAGIWTAAATIAGIEITAAVRAGAEGLELIAQAAIGVMLGLAIRAHVTRTRLTE